MCRLLAATVAREANVKCDRLWQLCDGGETQQFSLRQKSEVSKHKRQQSLKTAVIDVKICR